MEENESQQRGWKAHDTINSPKNIRLTSMEYFSQRRRRRVTVGDRIPAAAFNVDSFVMFVLAMAAAVAGTDGRQLPLLPTAVAAALNEALREMRAIFFRWLSWRDVESSVDEIDFIDVDKCRLLSSDLAINFSRCSCCSRWSGSRSAAASYAS